MVVVVMPTPVYGEKKKGQGGHQVGKSREVYPCGGSNGQIDHKSFLSFFLSFFPSFFPSFLSRINTLCAHFFSCPSLQI
jgi:hypothetical protein